MTTSKVTPGTRKGYARRQKGYARHKKGYARHQSNILLSNERFEAAKGFADFTIYIGEFTKKLIITGLSLRQWSRPRDFHQVTDQPIL